MKRWLEETHGARFELLRHFLRRFFDSDIVAPEMDAKVMMAWTFAMVAPWFLMFTQALIAKYARFTGGSFRTAVKADELWLIMLAMGAVGLLTAVKWDSLFPGRHDYYALGTLPLRTRDIFAAKLAALLVVATAAMVVIVALPSVLFPAITGGRWALERSMAGRMWAHGTASVAGCAFFFFAIVGLQGVLLNALRPRAFGRVSGTAQGLAVAAMLAAILLSFTVGPPQMKKLEASAWAQWLPPFWYVGLAQSMMGSAEASMQALARRGVMGLEVAAFVALASYLVSYGRHKAWMMEGPPRPSRDRRWTGAVLDFAMESPRQQAVMVFLWKTLGRSARHRMILMGYVGAAGAILAATMGLAGGSVRDLTAAFVWVHGVTLTFLLLGLRHLFSIPTELRANWVFQMTESEGRAEWLDAVDRFVLWSGAVVVLALPLPFEARLIGWRTLGAAALFATTGLMLYEWMFREWRKLPFTCSKLPGKTPLWIVGLYGIGVVSLAPAAALALEASLFSGAGFVFVLVMTWAAWRRLHAARRVAWGELRLMYEEAAEPAVGGLGLGR